LELLVIQRNGRNAMNTGMFQPGCIGAVADRGCESHRQTSLEQRLEVAAPAREQDNRTNHLMMT
jgi:hypothetical protein